MLSAGGADRAIVEEAAKQQRVILTQDLDFSAIVALERRHRSSILSLRLTSARIEHVNALLRQVLPAVEDDLLTGAVVSVEDARIRVRRLPVD